MRASIQKQIAMYAAGGPRTRVEWSKARSTLCKAQEGCHTLIFLAAKSNHGRHNTPSVVPTICCAVRAAKIASAHERNVQLNYIVPEGAVQAVRKAIYSECHIPNHKAPSA
eukprot:IDg15380t1